MASFLSQFLPKIFKKDGTVWTSLLDIIDFRVKASKTPVHGVYTTDVVIDKAGDVWARIFAPKESKESNPVVVYIHGGGYAMYGPSTMDYDKLGRKIATALNAVVISVNYRLAPVSRHPNQHDDCFKALEWLRDQPAGSEYLPATADVSQCFLAGDSAGGNAVHHVGCRAASADLGPVKIRGWFMLQPFFGGEERTVSEHAVKNPVLLTNELADWFWRAFLPDGADRDHEASNVFGPNAPDISRLPLPPIFVIIGTHDILKDREVAYAKEMARIVGKDNVLVKKYAGGFHGFFAYDLDLQKVLMVDLASFVQGVLAKPKS